MKLEVRNIVGENQWQTIKLYEQIKFYTIQVYLTWMKKGTLFAMEFWM